MTFLAKKIAKFSRRISNILGTPLGIIITVGLVILFTEVIIMQVLFILLPASVHLTIPREIFNLLDAAILTIAVSPALYFLIFQRMRADTEKLSKITGGAQDAIILMDAAGRVIFWNKAASEIFGYSEEEALWNDLHTLIAPTNSLNAFQNNFQHFRKTGTGPILSNVREVVALRKGGQEFPAELSVSALLLNGEWNAVGIVRDITARKRREAILREREQELAEANESLKNKEAKESALLSSLGEGMIATDNNGNIIAINRVAENMLDWREGEVIGKRLVDVLPAVDDEGNMVPPEKRICAITAGSDKCGGTLTDDTMSFVKKNGDTIPVAVTTTPIVLNNECSGAVVIFRDITSEKELERTRRDLLSLASHQLRTPLSGTKWLIETLQRGIHGALNEKQNEYLTEIYKINEQMTNLVRDMLGVLRMEGDTSMAKEEQVSITMLIGNIFETLQSAATSKNITLVSEKTNEDTIITDPFLLRTVLESLISNAINYSKPGGKVEIDIKKNEQEVIFSVKDSGIGIPHDEQRQIFQRFYRATNAKTFDTHGTGLGLYISATLTKKMGGQLTFESEKDRGSTFYLHLPVKNSQVLPPISTNV